MLPPATWAPNTLGGGDNNLAPQLYASQVLPPGGEVGQGDVEDEMRKAEGERRELQRQLEALNLQHAEAQGKLYSMQQVSLCRYCRVSVHMDVFRAIYRTKKHPFLSKI